ncbi:MAG: hypothetical protein QOH01_1995 [Verrucomicrobiota bacterium]|jgi:hypothetical protein
MKTGSDQENIESSKTQDQTKEPTRSWCEKDGKPADQDRIDGLNEFKAKLPKDQIERDKLKDPDHARRMFAEWGGFYLEENAPADEEYRGIPKTTVFKCYEQQEGRPERDEQVILVLPSLDLSGRSNESYDQEVAKVWRCTYIPYLDEK